MEHFKGIFLYKQWRKACIPSLCIKEVFPSRVFTEELLKKMTKYAFSWYAKFELTCKCDEKCEPHIHDNNLYRPVMNRHYMLNHISLWLPTKSTLFNREYFHFLLGTLRSISFCIGHQLPFLVNQPSKQQSIYLRRRSPLNIRMFAKNIMPYVFTSPSLKGAYKINGYSPRAKFTISSNHNKHFRF